MPCLRQVKQGYTITTANVRNWRKIADLVTFGSADAMKDDVAEPVADAAAGTHLPALDSTNAASRECVGVGVCAPVPKTGSSGSPGFDGRQTDAKTVGQPSTGAGKVPAGIYTNPAGVYGVETTDVNSPYWRPLGADDALADVQRELLKGVAGARAGAGCAGLHHGDLASILVELELQAYAEKLRLQVRSRPI
jgi:hypothetical protein